MSDTLSKARSLIHAANRIQLITHISPDGDAIGSVLGLSWALRAVGKVTLPTCEDGCPETFRFLTGSDEIVKKVDPTADLYIILDCADKSRAGKPGEHLPRQPEINIDHHATNPNFALLNFVDSSATATSELIALLMPGLGLPQTKEAAEALLCGLVSDTLGFRTANTGSQALEVAQSLMAAGADLPRIYDYALNRRSFASARLWGEALSRATMADGIVWTTIPLASKQAVGYNGKGDADVINVLSTVNEGSIFVAIIETGENDVKISWRARPGLDVSKVAKAFGGGGHVAAAGANVRGKLVEVEQKVLEETRRLLSGADAEA